jgi:hypothetical protein
LPLLDAGLRKNNVGLRDVPALGEGTCNGPFPDTGTPDVVLLDVGPRDAPLLSEGTCNGPLADTGIFDVVFLDAGACGVTLCWMATVCRKCNA